MSVSKLRRSLLYIPGNNPNLIQNSVLFGADSLMFDLEDGVLASEKDAARELVRSALTELDFRGHEVLVRINGMDTPLGEVDLEAIVPAKPNGIRLPKANSPEDVKACDAIITRLERAHHLPAGSIFMILSLETTKAVLNAHAIATASKRVVGIAIGAEDYTADLQTERSLTGEELFYARSALVVAARAAGIQAIDTVFANVNDDAGLVAETEKIKQLGFDGKSLISPRQIGPVHKVFTPDAVAIERAKAVVAAFNEAKAKNLGVISLNGRMVDLPVVLRAQRVLRLAGLEEQNPSGGAAK